MLLKQTSRTLNCGKNITMRRIAKCICLATRVHPKRTASQVPAIRRTKHGADYVSLENYSSIATLLSEGRALLDEHDPVDAHVEFGRWVDRVAHWLETEIRSPVLSARWSGLSYSGLVTSGGYYDDPTVWASFRRGVQQRLQWLGQALGQSRGSEKKTNEGVLHASSATIRKVFVVHGHDEGARESIARFLERSASKQSFFMSRPVRAVRLSRRLKLMEMLASPLCC